MSSAVNVTLTVDYPGTAKPYTIGVLVDTELMAMRARGSRISNIAKARYTAGELFPQLAAMYALIEEELYGE